MIRKLLNFLRPRPRVLIRVLPARTEADTKRIFSEWPATDERLAVTLQLIQDHIDAAQASLSGHRYDPTKLAADAGAVEALENLLAELAMKVAKENP